MVQPTMADSEEDSLRASLESWIGQPLSDSGPALAPDAVNLPMIRHWVDALDDQNPIYLDAGFAATTRHGNVVAPPAMLQNIELAEPFSFTKGCRLMKFAWGCAARM